MRRLTGTGLIALTILLCFARPASAQWDFLKWLEELSGPGHFVMNGVDVAVVLAGPNPTQLRTRTSTTTPSAIAMFATWNNIKWFVGAQLLAGRGTRSD